MVYGADCLTGQGVTCAPTPQPSESAQFFPTKTYCSPEAGRPASLRGLGSRGKSLMAEARGGNRGGTGVGEGA